MLYKFVSLNWKSRNDLNFIEADKCFKISTCDLLDDVVDNFSVLPTGVAMKLAQNTYTHSKWKVLYDSLCLIFDLEHFYFCKKEAEVSFRITSNGSSKTTEDENPKVDIEKAAVDPLLYNIVGGQDIPVIPDVSSLR